MDMTKEELLAAVRGVVQEELKAAKPVEVLTADEKVADKDTAGKFKSFGDFLSSIARMRSFGIPDNRLVYKTERGEIVKPAVNVDGKATLVEGTDSAGGFLVPEEYRAELQSIGLEQAVVRRANPFVVPMRSDTLTYPIVNDQSHASSVHGGVVAYWTKEGAVGTESEPTFGNITLTAKKLSGYTKVSNELLADSAIALEPFLRRQFGEAWAWFEDLAFLRGSGSGQPLGVYNAAATISVTRQDTDEVFVKDVYNLYSRMMPGSRDRAVWILNNEVLPQLLWMHSANTSTNAYGAPQVFQPNIIDPLKQQILGRPYFVTEKMPGLGDAGDFGFYDFGSYLIGERSPLVIDMSSHVYWSTDHIAYKFTERIDAQPLFPAALTPYGSQDTLSPFVMLGAAS
jgi:HK97 family phage major capsid protein